MRKLITTLFVITTIIFAVVYFLERKDAKKLEEQLVQKEHVIKTTEQELAVSKSDAAKLKSSKKELTAQIKQHTEKLEEIATAEEEDSDKTAAENFSSGLSEMMESPEMQDTVRLQLESTLINPVFGNLFKKLELTEDDTEVFKNLLSERMMIGVTSGMKMMTADKEERIALKDQINQGEEEVDSMINDLLGEEGYEQYKSYKDTTGERMACNQFNQQLEMSEAALSAEQNKQLITVMYDERLEAQKSPEYFDMEKSDPGDFNDETIQKSIIQQEKINKGTSRRAKKFLKAEQLEKLDLFLINLQRQREMQLKMAQKMFGGNNK